MSGSRGLTCAFAIRAPARLRTFPTAPPALPMFCRPSRCCCATAWTAPRAPLLPATERLPECDTAIPNLIVCSSCDLVTTAQSKTFTQAFLHTCFLQGGDLMALQHGRNSERAGAQQRLTWRRRRSEQNCRGMLRSLDWMNGARKRNALKYLLVAR